MAQNLKRVDIDVKTKFITTVGSTSSVLPGGDIVEKDSKGELTKKPANAKFINAFGRLTPHLLFSCELATPKTFGEEWFDTWKFEDDKRFEGIAVTGVVFLNDEAGVKLLGRKTLRDGSVVPLNGPNIWFESDSEFKYIFIKQLDEHIDELKLQLSEYQKGKYGEIAQQELVLK